MATRAIVNFILTIGATSSLGLDRRRKVEAGVLKAMTCRFILGRQRVAGYLLILEYRVRLCHPIVPVLD